MPLERSCEIIGTALGVRAGVGESLKVGDSEVFGDLELDEHDLA